MFKRNAHLFVWLLSSIGLMIFGYLFLSQQGLIRLVYALAIVGSAGLFLISWINLRKTVELRRPGGKKTLGKVRPPLI